MRLNGDCGNHFSPIGGYMRLMGCNHASLYRLEIVVHKNYHSGMSGLENLSNAELLTTNWKPSSLRIFIYALNSYLVKISPKQAVGNNRISDEVKFVKKMIQKFRGGMKNAEDDSDDVEVVMEVEGYKLLSDLIHKYWAYNNRRLKIDREKNTVEGALEGKEREVEGIRDLLQNEVFQKMERRKALVDNLFVEPITKDTDRSETINQQIESGAIEAKKRKFSEEVINKISSPKVKQLCIEINKTPDDNSLSLVQNIGEVLKWTLWHKAKEVGTKLNEQGNLQPLLNEAIGKPYFKSNSVNRFLKNFRDNFYKTQYDLVRHSEDYIPEINIDPVIDSLENILKETFP